MNTQTDTPSNLQTSYVTGMFYFLEWQLRDSRSVVAFVRLTKAANYKGCEVHEVDLQPALHCTL